MGLPYPVRFSYEQLDRRTQSAFMRDYRLRQKSLVFAYLAWIMLGWHYLYLRRVPLQFAFWFTMGGFFVWWAIDVFRIPGLVVRLNEDTARELMAEYRAMVPVAFEVGPKRPGESLPYLELR